MINYIEKIIALGIVQGLRPIGDNPAIWKGNLALAFPKNTHKVQHQRSVDWQLMPEFMLKLQAMNKARLPGTKEEIPLLIFQILTVARPSEARLADWSEIDLEQKVWFIPNSDAELRKSDKEWMVPLCKEAIKILKDQGPKKKGRIFNNQGDEIPNAYVSAIPGAIGYDGVAHGFRSTFETWEQETQDKNWSQDAVRLAMKHTEGDKVRAAYARGQCYAERIRLMAAYEKWLYKGETKANVIPIRKRKTG
jgi:integrase